MEQSGAAALTVHGRTRMQYYAPPVDLDIIAAVKAAVSIPVIGNGDCIDIQSVVNMYDYTKCDLVMIGRGALKPLIFSQVARYLKKMVSHCPRPTCKHVWMLCSGIFP